MERLGKRGGEDVAAKVEGGKSAEANDVASDGSTQVVVREVEFLNEAQGVAGDAGPIAMRETLTIRRRFPITESIQRINEAGFKRQQS